MKNLLTKKDKLGSNTLHLLLCTLLVAGFSTTVTANRPAMDDRPMTDTTEVTPMEAPETSSVDLMMKQQPVQTGDVLQLPAKEIQPGETVKIQLLDYPRRGMSMQKVQFEYGEPITISDSVGKPPITRWTYNDRIVYFEFSTVLHVVAR